jgi:catalase
LYREVMTDTDRDHLATNIIAHASDGVTSEMQRRVVGYWTNVDSGLGAKVAVGLGLDNGAGPVAGGRSTSSGAGRAAGR